MISLPIIAVHRLPVVAALRPTLRALPVLAIFGVIVTTFPGRRGEDAGGFESEDEDEIRQKPIRERTDSANTRWSNCDGSWIQRPTACVNSQFFEITLGFWQLLFIIKSFTLSIVSSVGSFGLSAFLTD